MSGSSGQTGRASSSNMCFLLRHCFHLAWCVHTHTHSLSEDGLSRKREGKERLQGLGWVVGGGVLALHS